MNLNWFHDCFRLRPAAKLVVCVLLSLFYWLLLQGSIVSAKSVLTVPRHASEPFSLRALTTTFSLGLSAKPVMKPVEAISA